MKLRRMMHSDTGRYQSAVELGNEWRLVGGFDGDLLFFCGKGIHDIASEFNLVPFDEGDYQDALPFEPAAYRDFMLYEQHALDAARGFVRMYIPRLYPVVSCFEKLTGRTFPMLKPSARYYEFPVFYMGNHLNMMPHNQPVQIPEYTKQLDYELELAAVLIKPLKNAAPEDVADAIGGFVILNDFSARDVQLSEMKSGFGPMKSKNFGSAVSSVMVTADELLPVIDQLAVRVLVNGECVATGTTAHKMYSFAEAIAYASWEEQLHPGELFGSGTVPGCSGIENGRMLNAGDCVRLEVEQIGYLENTIV